MKNQNVIEVGIPYITIPHALQPTGNVGRCFFVLRSKRYIIDVFPYADTGELCWTAQKWDGQRWKKVPCFTRSEERRFPKTLAKQASMFLSYCKKMLSANH